MDTTTKNSLHRKNNSTSKKVQRLKQQRKNRRHIMTIIDSARIQINNLKIHLLLIILSLMNIKNVFIYPNNEELTLDGSYPAPQEKGGRNKIKLIYSNFKPVKKCQYNEKMLQIKP